MKLFDRHLIRRMSQLPTDFLSFFKAQIDILSFEDAVIVLKISAIYFDKNKKQSSSVIDKQRKIFDECLILLKDTYPNRAVDISNLRYGCDVIHTITEEYYEDFFQQEFNLIDDKKKIISFLSAVEMYASYLLAIAEGISWEQLEKNYPFTIINEQYKKTSDINQHTLNNYVKLIDQISYYTGKILKYFLIDNVYSGDLAQQVLIPDEVKASIGHLHYYDQYDSIERIYQLYSLCNASVNWTTDKLLFDLDNDNFYKDFELSRCRLTSRQMSLTRDDEYLLFCISLLDNGFVVLPMTISFWHTQ